MVASTSLEEPAAPGVRQFFKHQSTQCRSRDLCGCADLGDFYRYHPATNAWTSSASMAPLCTPGSYQLEGLIKAFPGASNSGLVPVGDLSEFVL